MNKYKALLLNPVIYKPFPCDYSVRPWYHVFRPPGIQDQAVELVTSLLCHTVTDLLSLHSISCTIHSDWLTVE